MERGISGWISKVAGGRGHRGLSHQVDTKPCRLGGR